MQLETRLGKPDELFVRSCTQCGHISICTMMRAVAPLLGDFTEEHRPFEPTDMAVICTKFISLAAMEVLTRGDNAL